MNPIRSLAVAGGLALAALAAPGAATAQDGPASTVTVRPQEGSDRGERRAPRRRRDVLTREELEESGTSNLFDAIDRLRPQWMRARGASNLAGAGQAIVVYQNNTQLGGIDVLRTLNLEFAEEVRFLDSTQASNTLPGLGSRSVGGAIVIMRPGTTR